MNEKTLETIYGALLHDLGKVVHRAGAIDGRRHSISGAEVIKEIFKNKNILDCIKYHHKRELANAQISDDSPAYAVYLADNISAGADRRDKIEEGEQEKGFDRNAPLSSVFNLMNGNRLNYSYPMKYLDDEISFPTDDSDNKMNASFYNETLQNIKDALRGIETDKSYINSLLMALECYLSFIPSSTSKEEECDISLYDHCKITAGVGACISEFLVENECPNWKEELVTNEKEFCKKDIFIMYSCDFSGIQKFIYNISTKNALKSLRSRSFVLEMLMEHICDEIILCAGVSRANIIYSGGGHCYILLPNTEKTKANLTVLKSTLDQWIQKNFGISLYLADAYCTCSSNDLMNIPAKEEPYKKIFQRLSSSISEKKLTRYSANGIRALNQSHNKQVSRECKICGMVEGIKSKSDICFWCDLFAAISNSLIKENLIFFTCKKEISDLAGFPMPSLDGEIYMHLSSEERAKKELEKGTDILRLYSKNKPYTGLQYSTNIYMGDYVANSILEELVNDTDGIERMAVCRADVDNLGQAFASGFERKGENFETTNKYVTLSRTATFSRNMSMFFKYYINGLLSQKSDFTPYSISNNSKERTGRRIVVVYSGGDDVFLVGAWKDILEFTVDLQKCFHKYTLGTLTISAGIGVFGSKYPLYKAAYDTAKLEDTAKGCGKNAVCLFSPEEKSNDTNEKKSIESHCYRWSHLTDKVVGEKLNQLMGFFDSQENEERGKAFLYKLLDLLRSTNEKINIARYAYLLARLEPAEKGSNAKGREEYIKFSKNMYRWILDEKDRKELITAMYIYVYLTRKRSDS